MKEWILQALLVTQVKNTHLAPGGVAEGLRSVLYHKSVRQRGEEEKVTCNRIAKTTTGE